MRFWGMVMIGMACLGTGSAFADGLSKRYQQCMTATYGDTDTIQKCIKKELKAQNKRMNKYYKKYLRNAGQYEDSYKLQHQLWASRVNRVCGTNTTSVHTVIQQRQCILGMTVERAEYYKKKTRVYE